MHCIAQSILEIALHRSRWQHGTEIVGRLLQLRIGQIELHSVGKYRPGVPENSRSEDWFVEHRIATWGLRQDNASNQWSSPAPIVHYVVTKWAPTWTPAGGISATCTHLLCATQCLTDGQMSPNVFPLKVMSTAAVVDLSWHPLGLSPQQGFFSTE